VPIAAAAGPDSCKKNPDVANAYQCTGDQSAGIKVSSESAIPSTATRVDVNPAGGIKGPSPAPSYGVWWEASGNGPNPVALNINTGNHSIHTFNLLGYDSARAAVQVSSQGDHGENQGDAGKQSRGMQVVFEGNIQSNKGGAGYSNHRR